MDRVAKTRYIARVPVTLFVPVSTASDQAAAGAGSEVDDGGETDGVSSGQKLETWMLLLRTLSTTGCPLLPARLPDI